MAHKFSINNRGLSGTEVLIDGQNIAHSLTGLTLTMGAGRVPAATLDLLLIDVTEVQDAETRILIPDSTRDALIALGWTPPTEEEPAP